SILFFFSSRRRHTRSYGDWSSDVCSSDLEPPTRPGPDAKPRTRSYAKLKGFDRVFEIDSDKLNPVFVSADTLRDNQIARFKSERSEERRVGKECRSEWAAGQEKNKRDHGK